MERVFHTIEPVYDKNSLVLILGSMPSPKSREEGFYYAHPQNRFWRVMAEVFGENVPQGRIERRAFALSHHFALWDVLASCDIEGASDASIKNPVPNDINSILRDSGIKRIFTTGGTADRLYRKYCEAVTGMPAHRLSSTSAANAAACFDKLVGEYRVIAGEIAALGD